MRQFASGVLVITSELEGRLHATTATAFPPLSAEPPLVLVCLHRDSDTHRALAQTPRFGINMLASSQAGLSARFAGKTHDRYRFDDVPRFLGPNGVTFLKGSAAHVEVKTESTTAGGDHTIFVGLVTWLQADPRLSPLVYHQGTHHELTSLAKAETCARDRLTG
jgi:flavin reductase (DIM6/NTAB) family NADH-FMN oxidoreductase RutF